MATISKESCLHQAARNAGFSDFLEALGQSGGSKHWQVVTEAMELYATAKQVACLEKAADNASVRRTFFTTDGREIHESAAWFAQQHFSYKADKESITNPDNLV